MAKAKNKDLGINIVYRVVLAVLAAAVPVVAFFSKIFYAIVDSTALQILASLQGNTNDSGSTEFTYSLYEITQKFGGSQGESSNILSSVWESLSSIQAALISTVVFFFLAVLMALVIFIFNIFCKNRFVTLCLSGGGTLFLIAMLISFNAAAAPIIDGTISLSTLLGSSLFGSSMLSGILSYVASVSVLRVSSAWYIMLFLFIGIMVWSGAYLLIEAGDKKAK